MYALGESRSITKLFIPDWAVIWDPNESLPTYMLVEHKNGITSSIFLSYNEKTLSLLKKIIPSSHLFVELRPGFQENIIHNLARKLRLEVVVTGDVYFKSKRLIYGLNFWY